MKKINIRNSILALMTCLLVASCSDEFLDVNDNPNNPPISRPSLTLPVAQQQLASLNGTTMMYLGQYFAYNYAVPSNWSANGELLRYNVNRSFYTSIFESSYADIFKNLTYLENYTDGSGNVDYSAYKVISQTMKGLQYQYLVDLYGDVPYTEANQRSENLTPKYDDAETVYKSVIDSLTSYANVALNLPENAENPGESDIIFSGDMTKWAQFANTIKLRMLVRLSNSGQDAYIQDQIALIMDNGAGFIEEDVTANPSYSQNEDRQAPIYDYLGYSPTGVERDRHDFTVGTDYAINNLINTNDTIRLKRIYDPTENYHDYFGVYQAIDLPGSGYTADDLSAVGPGIIKSPDMDQPVLLLAEALLLQSEAVQRGYMQGDAEQLYNDGIQASFDYLSIGAEDEDVDAEPYYTQPINNVSWDASTNKIEAIITQKWIALNGISIEPWIEYTRTGYPSDLPLSEDGDERPVRLLYPTSEYSRNADNVPATTPDDAFNKDPFWR